MITLQEASQLVIDKMEDGTMINSSMEYESDFLFLIVRPTGEERFYDPFVKVNRITGEVSDFSPQEYDEPRVIVNTLVRSSQHNTVY